MKRLLLIAFALSFSSLVKANEFDSYVGIGIGVVTLEEEVTITVGATDYDVDTKAEPAALFIKAGGYLENNFGLEARISFGLAGYGDSYTIEVDGTNSETNAKAEVDSILGLYGTYRVGVGETSSFYGLFGTTFGTLSLIDEDTGSTLAEADETSWSFGVGFNFAGFNIEWISYLHDETYDVTAVNAGYMIQF